MKGSQTAYSNLRDSIPPSLPPSRGGIPEGVSSRRKVVFTHNYLRCDSVCFDTFLSCFFLFFEDAVPVRVAGGRQAQQGHLRDHLLRSGRGVRRGVYVCTLVRCVPGSDVRQVPSVFFVLFSAPHLLRRHLRSTCTRVDQLSRGWHSSIYLFTRVIDLLCCNSVFRLSDL